jgi:PAS domain S-box-containing protein
MFMDDIMSNKKPTYQELEKKVLELEEKLAKMQDVEVHTNLSELKYKTLFESANDAIFLADAESGIIIDANTKAESLTGYSRNEIIGMHQSQLHPENENQKAKASFRQDISLNEHTILKQFHIVHKDGNLIPVEINPSVIELKDKKYLYGIFRDITERIEAGKKLQEQTALLNEAEEILNLGSWSWNVKQDIVQWSSGLFKIFKRNPEKGSINWKQHHNLYLKEDYEQYKKVVEKCLSDGEPYEFELRAIRSDGEIRNCIAKGEGKKDITGKITTMYGTLLDITEQKQAEQALKESEAKYKEAQQIAKLGNWTLDIVNNKLSWSDEIYRIFELEPQEFKATYEAFLEFIHPDDRENVNFAYTNSLKTKAPYEIEHRVITKNNTVKYVKEKCKTTFDKTGKPLESVGIVIDITEQKQAEMEINLMAEMLKLAPNAITISDYKGKFLYVNQKTLDLYGYTLEEFKDIPLSKLDTPESAVQIPVRMQEIIKNGEGVFQTESFKKDGTILQMELHVKTTKWNDIDALITVGTDITERKKAEEALKESELYFRTIFNNISDAVFYQDIKTGRIISANETARQIYGYSDDELKGMEIHQIDVVDNTVEIEKRLKTLYEKGVVTFESVHVTKNGVHFPVEAKAKIVDDKTFISVARDLSERKQADKALKESEAKFKTIFSSSADTILLADPETGIIVDANNVASQLFEKPVDEIIGMHQQDLYPNELKGISVEAFNRRPSNNSNATQPVEIEVLTDNGKRKTVEIRGSIIQIDGKEFVLGNFRDITDRKKAEKALKESEEKYRLLSENISDGIMLIENDEIKYVSEGSSKLFGYPRKILESLTSEDLFDYIHPDDRDRIYKTITESKKNQIKNYVYTGRVRKSNGEYIWIEDSVNSQYDKYGKRIRSVIRSRNVDEYKKAEMALKESESRYRKAEKVGKVGNWEYNISTDKFWASEETKRIFGFIPDNNYLSTEDVESCIPDRENVHQSLVDLIEKEVDYNLEYEIITFDKGNRKNIISVAQLEKDAFGQPIKVTGVVQDITARKKAEIALKESEEKLSLIVNKSPFPVAIADLNNEKIYYWSKNATKMFGHTPTSVSEWYNLAYPDSDYRKQVIEKWSPYLETARKSYTAIYTGEYHITCKDGSIKICEIFAQYIPENVVVSFNNITDRKKAEIALKDNIAKLDSIVAIYQKDHKNRMELLDFTLNEAVELTDSQIGYIYFYDNESENFTLHSWSKNVMKECAIANPDRMYHLEKTGLWGEAVRQRKPIMVNDFNAPNEYKKGYPEGHSKLLKFLTIPVFQNNEIVAVVGVANKKTDYTQTDILHLTILMENTWTVLEKIEKDEFIKEQNKELKKLNADKDRFMSILAHDLRAPFNSLIGFSNLLMELVPEDEDNEISEYATIINNTLNITLNYLNNLLDWARLQENKMEFEPTHLSLNELLEVVVRYLSLQAESKKISISTNVPDEMTIYADKNMMQIILTNLISNAIKYTNESGKIEIAAFTDKTYNILTVEDNGIGMSKVVSEILFKIEESFSTPGTENELGTGLGLILCKDFVDKHNGQIEVESELNKGSKFIIKLPIS